jgi:putative ABC transport system ATP-binding protein
VGDRCITALDDRGRTLFRRAHIGFVFQFFNLIPTLTVGENVRLTAELSGWSAADAQKQADRMLNEVGLLDRARAYADKLSGGEQQRVAIARALCANPPLILADEPTGNLDVDTGAQVMQLLARLTRERGKTLVMVTHSAEIAAMAGRVFRLDHGRLVVESAPPQAVTSAGTKSPASPAAALLAMPSAEPADGEGPLPAV